MDKSKKYLKNQRGQASIEFIITFIFTIGVFIFFIRLALNMSAGFMAHYATFMASRSYLVMDNGSNRDFNSDTNALEEARRIFSSFRLGRFGISGASATLDANAPEYPAKKYEYVGIRYSFRLPLTGYKIFGGNETLNLQSESFLGREPVRANCYERTCEAMKGINNAGGDCTDHTTLYDNGC